MKNIVVVGSQWGDEGKGKIVDWLSSEADIVVRFQGGHNAGHTLVIDGITYKLRLLPSGIVRKNKIIIIGNGVVVNEDATTEEIEEIKSKLSKYGKFDSGLEMDLRHLGCWKSFVPKIIRDEAGDIERKLKTCISNSVKECGGMRNSILITLARKGDVLVRHLCELASKSEDEFKELVKNSLSDVEFFLKIKKGESSDAIDKLIIFDDAIDRGVKLKDVLSKLIDSGIKEENINIIAFVANKKELNSLSKDIKDIKEVCICNEF